jgi:hypothetical protein
LLLLALRHDHEEIKNSEHDRQWDQKPI